MNRSIVAGLSALTLLVVGLGVGYLVARIVHARSPGQTVQDELESLAPQLSMLMGADLQPVETDFDDWLYPDAESDGRSSNISGSVNGKPFEFQRRASMHTADDFETVTRHYENRLRAILPIERDYDWQLGGSGSAGFNGVLVSYVLKDHERDRPVQVGFIGLQAKNCHVHLCITRADDEQQTHVIVMFSKWHVDGLSSD